MAERKALRSMGSKKGSAGVVDATAGVVEHDHDE
jgi:hypothetical protein